jgi:20S proteasome alpha/beta subunit
MTVVVAFLCTDGVVIAADSMLTTSSGPVPIAHLTGRKVDVLAGPQVFAYAGDQGQGARFRVMANANHAAIARGGHALDYPIGLTQALIQQFQSTGIANAINVNTVLAFVHGGAQQCCVFDGPIQPRLLDPHHFFVAIGSGKLAADPFLRFLVDIFSPNGPPTVREAVFLATWTVEHVIHTNPGGVAGPLRIATLQQGPGGLAARELPDTEIDEHRQAMASAAQALRAWRDGMQSGAAAEGVAGPPEMPTAPEPPPV